MFCLMPLSNPVVTGFMVAEMVGYVYLLATPVVVKRGRHAMSPELFPAQLVKVPCSVKEVTVLSTSPLNREPKHRGYSLLSMSTRSLCFPHNFNIASFLLFSDKKLKELAAS